MVSSIVYEDRLKQAKVEVIDGAHTPRSMSGEWIQGAKEGGFPLLDDFLRRTSSRYYLVPDMFYYDLNTPLKLAMPPKKKGAGN